MICGVAQLGIAGCKNAIVKLGSIQVNRRVMITDEQKGQEVPDKAIIKMCEPGVGVAQSTKWGNFDMDKNTHRGNSDMDKNVAWMWIYLE